MHINRREDTWKDMSIIESGLGVLDETSHKHHFHV